MTDLLSPMFLLRQTAIPFLHSDLEALVSQDMLDEGMNDSTPSDIEKFWGSRL